MNDVDTRIIITNFDIPKLIKNSNTIIKNKSNDVNGSSVYCIYITKTMCFSLQTRRATVDILSHSTLKSA